MEEFGVVKLEKIKGAKRRRGDGGEGEMEWRGRWCGRGYGGEGEME